MDVRAVDAGGVSIEIGEAGSGERRVLLVHGFTGAKDDANNRRTERLCDANAERQMLLGSAPFIFESFGGGTDAPSANVNL